MPARVRVLSDSDVETLRDVVAQVRRGRVNTTGRPDVTGEEEPSPNLYVARTPVGGIPALTEEAGAGIADTPGSADCDVYFLSEETAGTVIRPVSSMTQRVHNLSATAIPGDTWVPVGRTTHGLWMAFPAGGGGTSWDYTSAAVPGVISLAGTLAAPQVIGDGVKAFQDPVELITNFAANNSYVAMTGSGGTAPSFKIEMVNAGTVASRFSFTSTGLQINDLLLTAYNFQLTLGATPAITFPEFGVTASPGTNCTLRVGGDLGTTQQVGAFSRTVAAGGAYFFVGANNGITETLTFNTSAPGQVATLTLKGGIITGRTLS